MWRPRPQLRRRRDDATRRPSCRTRGCRTSVRCSRRPTVSCASDDVKSKSAQSVTRVDATAVLIAISRNVFPERFGFRFRWRRTADAKSDFPNSSVRVGNADVRMSRGSRVVKSSRERPPPPPPLDRSSVKHVGGPRGLRRERTETTTDRPAGDGVRRYDEYAAYVVVIIIIRTISVNAFPWPACVRAPHTCNRPGRGFRESFSSSTWRNSVIKREIIIITRRRRTDPEETRALIRRRRRRRKTRATSTDGLSELLSSSPWRTTRAKAVFAPDARESTPVTRQGFIFFRRRAEGFVRHAATTVTTPVRRVGFISRRGRSGAVFKPCTDDGRASR